MKKKVYSEEELIYAIEETEKQTLLNITDMIIMITLFILFIFFTLYLLKEMI